MRTAHVLVAGVFASGCAALTGISSDYPRGWPHLARQASGCPDLTGRYINDAQYSYLPTPAANGLLERLDGKRGRAISLRSLPQQLVIEAEPASGEPYRRTLSMAAGDFSCVDGALVLKPIIESAAEGVGGYRSERRLGLRRAANGDLIGEDRLFSIGAVVWLVPIAGSQTFWYRWGTQ